MPGVIHDTATPQMEVTWTCDAIESSYYKCRVALLRTEDPKGLLIIAVSIPQPTSQPTSHPRPGSAGPLPERLAFFRRWEKRTAGGDMYDPIVMTLLAPVPRPYPSSAATRGRTRSRGTNAHGISKVSNIGRPARTKVCGANLVLHNLFRSCCITCRARRRSR